jgi:hypothetical protein
MGKRQNVQNEHVKEELEKKKSLKYFHGEVGTEAAGQAANDYASASIERRDGSAQTSRLLRRKTSGS